MSPEDLVPIDPTAEIKWSWTTNATKNFKGAKFDIQMQMIREKANQPQKASLDLPLNIAYDKGKGPFEKYAPIIGSIIGGLIGLASAFLVMMLTPLRENILQWFRGAPKSVSGPAKGPSPTSEKRADDKQP
jgi:hypothetical protein